MSKHLKRVMGVVLWAGVGAQALAQESTDMPAAVQPGLEVLMVRQNAMRMQMRDDRPGSADFTHVEFDTMFDYGLTRDLALMVHVPVAYRDFEEPIADDDAEGWGLEDAPVFVQWRFLQRDTGPLNTQRMSLLVGVEVPTFVDGFSSESVDPLLGVAYTQIWNRHGFNASVLYKMTTGQGDGLSLEFGDSLADALMIDGSYLYRLSPEQYTAQTTGSHYAQFQMLGRFETNDDAELIFAPGYMYEGQEWAFEATVHLPLWQDIEERPELEWGFNVGLRLLF